MKSFSHFLFIILFSFAIMGCEKDDDKPSSSSSSIPGNTSGGNEIKATLDGTAVTFRPFAFYTSPYITVGGFQGSADFPQLLLSAADTIVAKSYSFPNANGISMYYSVNKDSAIFFTSGNITVTKLDTNNNKLQGTFQGTLKPPSNQSTDSMVITNGTFSFTY